MCTLRQGCHVGGMMIPLGLFVQERIDSFTMLHEAEAKTAYDHVTLNFERQDTSSLQTVLQKKFRLHIIISKLNFKGHGKVFCLKERL